MEDLNYDVVEEKLRDPFGEIVLEYDRLNYDTDILPETDEPAFIYADNVEYVLGYVPLYVYADYLKKNKDSITQEDLDNIDVKKFYDYLCAYYEDEVKEYAYNKGLYEYDYDYYGSRDDG